MWHDVYKNIPFKFDGREIDGLDCWGIVKMVYRDQLGIDLPNFNGALSDNSRETLRKVAAIAAEERKRWSKVDRPKEFDVVLMSPTGGDPYHVGVMVDRRNMLHVMEGCNSTIERVDGMRWKNRVEGFYRYAKS